MYYVSRKIWLLHGKYTLLRYQQNDIDIFFLFYNSPSKLEIIYAVALSENFSIICQLYLHCLSTLRQCENKAPSKSKQDIKLTNIRLEKVC